MSPSTYQTLKEDYEKLQDTLKTTKENLRKAREENVNGGIYMEKAKQKIAEQDQLIELMQEEFEKELADKVYSEADMKKVGRELNALYSQN